MAYEPANRELRRGTDVLIATPGRLDRPHGAGRVDLSDVEVLVLDEADRMLDMGFLPAHAQDRGPRPKTRQTLLFSATIDEGAIDGSATS